VFYVQHGRKNKVNYIFLIERKMISLNNKLISFILNLHIFIYLYIYYYYYCLNFNLISRVLEHSDLSMTSKSIHVSFVSVLGLISSLMVYKSYSQSRNEIYIITLENEQTKGKESYDHVSKWARDNFLQHCCIVLCITWEYSFFI
jgi:hypothetical protein